MYQVKCGDINIAKWREVQNELAGAFLVPLPNFKLPREADTSEAILICNGHALPHVELVMKGGLKNRKGPTGVPLIISRRKIL
jgi:hypothetical protein